MCGHIVHRTAERYVELLARRLPEEKSVTMVMATNDGCLLSSRVSYIKDTNSHVVAGWAKR